MQEEIERVFASLVIDCQCKIHALEQVLEAVKESLKSDNSDDKKSAILFIEVLHRYVVDKKGLELTVREKLQDIHAKQIHAKDLYKTVN